MEVRSIIILAILISWLNNSFSEEYQILTDKTGREIEAKFIRLHSSGPKITVQRKGHKKQVTVPVSSFDDNTQSTIQRWWMKSDFLDDRLLIIETDEVNKKSDDKSHSSSYGATEIENVTFDHFFNIDLSNKSTHSFDQVKLEYTLYYYQEQQILTYTKVREPNGFSVSSEKISGHGTLHNSEVINLPPKSKQKTSTKRIRLNTISNGIKSELEGIIIRITLPSETEEIIVREIIYPEKLEQSWTTETKDAQAPERPTKIYK